jgi:hypothetical protein
MIFCKRKYFIFEVSLTIKTSPSARHGGAWGERRYSSYSFMTSALDGGQWSVSHPSCALPLGKRPLVPIGQEAGWAPELVWTQRLEEKSFHLCQGSNLDRPVVQSVGRQPLNIKYMKTVKPMAVTIHATHFGMLQRGLYKIQWKCLLHRFMTPQFTTVESRSTE